MTSGPFNLFGASQGVYGSEPHRHSCYIPKAVRKGAIRDSVLSPRPALSWDPLPAHAINGDAGL